jgi:hypothetical protein
MMKKKRCIKGASARLDEGEGAHRRGGGVTNMLAAAQRTSGGATLGLRRGGKSFARVYRGK